MSEKQYILELLQRSLTVVLGDEAPTLEADLALADADITSLDLVEVLMVVEEKEGYTINAADIEGATTVGDLVLLIQAKRGAQR